jgi:hypothetical protein
MSKWEAIVAIVGILAVAAVFIVGQMIKAGVFT